MAEFDTERAREFQDGQHQTLVNQIHNLTLRFASPENANNALIPPDEYESLRNDLLRQKGQLEADLEAQNRSVEEWMELTERTFDFARYARLWFAQGALETKRAILASLGSHLVITDQKLLVTLHPVFQAFFENLEQAEKEIAQVRTSKVPANKRQTAQAGAVSPTLRRR